jgi:hypothetical protein
MRTAAKAMCASAFGRGHGRVLLQPMSATCSAFRTSPIISKTVASSLLSENGFDGT